MNCSNCGAPISLEEKYCPHCGQPNVQAMQHSRDMAHYNKEFEKTRSGVYRALKNYKGITARLIIFTIVLVCAIIAGLMMNSTYSMHRKRMEKEARANAREIEVQFQEYMDKMDYVTLSHYVDHYFLDNYDLRDDPVLGKYYSSGRILRNYGYFYDDLMRTITAKEDRDIERYTQNMNEDISQLYRYMYGTDEENGYLREQGDPEIFNRVCKDVEDLTDAFLISYLGFTEEETEDFHTMTEARRSVLLEDKTNVFREAPEGKQDE